MDTHTENDALALAVDTSGRVGSVALGVGDTILGIREFTGPMRHSAELFPAIDSLLEDSGNTRDKIAHIYITNGPGSYTGLRITATMAKMMAMASKVRIVAMSTLDALAENIKAYCKDTNSPVTKAAVILDAKRNHFFISTYDYTDGKLIKTTADAAMTADQFVAEHEKLTSTVYLLGEGLKYYAGKFNCENVVITPADYWTVKAENVYHLGHKKATAGDFADPETLLPVYLRKTDAEEAWDARHNG